MKNKFIKLLLCFFFLSAFATTTFASIQAPPDAYNVLSKDIACASQGQTPDTMCAIQMAAKKINNDLFQAAVLLAAAALMLQWTLAHSKELLAGETTSLLAKLVGVISWFGITLWLLDSDGGMKWFSNSIDQYLAMAGTLAGVPAASFNPGAILLNGITVMGQINWAFIKSFGILTIFTGFDNLIMLTVAQIFMFLSYLVVALCVFVARLEFWIIFAVAPLAFGLIPLAAFRDQGIAPIKGLMSLGLRIIILGMVVGVLKTLSQIMISQMENPLPNDPTFMGGVFFFLGGTMACAVMAFAAGKIASSIASGSASFSGSDAIKGAMQMAAVAAPVAAAAGIAASLAKGGVGAAAGAVKGAAQAFSGRNNLGVSPGGGAAPTSGAPIVGGPLLSSSGKGINGTLLSSSGWPASATPEGGGGDGSPAAGGSSGGTAGGGTSSSSSGGSQSEGSTGAPASSATSGGGVGSSSKSAGSSGGSKGESSTDAHVSPASTATPGSGMGASGKVDGNTSTPLASGDASSAGIGGGNPNADQQKGRSRLSELGNSAGKALEHLSQDHQAVSVQINTRAD